MADDAGSHSDGQRSLPESGSLDRALHAYRRSGHVFIVVGVALIVAMVVFGLLMEHAATDLERSGLHTPGTVVRVEDGGPFFSEGDILVRFTVNGRWRTEQINLDSNSPAYRIGDSVDVIYDPRDPSNIRTSTETNDPSGTVIALTAGVVGGPAAIGIGWAVLRRARRWRRLIAVHGWRMVEASYIAVASGQSVQPLVRLRDGSSSVVRGVVSTTRWRLRAFRDISAVWAAGPLDGVMVVAPAVGGPLFEVREARRPAKQARWESRFREPEAT